MRENNFSRMLPVSASMLSGVLLFLAFPTYDLGWLAWVGLIPLLLAISGRSPAQGFFLSLVCGIIHFGGFFSWSFNIPGYKFLHHVLLLGFYFGPFLGTFGLTFNLILRRHSVISAFLAAPFIWVCLEYVRSNLFFLSFPWPLLSHSQYKFLPLIQCACFTGAYGISFLVVLVNSALALAVLTLLNRSERFKTPFFNPPSKNWGFVIMVITTALITLSLTYGWMALSRQPTGKKITVSVVQGNIDKEKKANPRKHTKFIMQKYTDLTQKVAQEQPDLIVWPEAATPGFVLKNMDLFSQLTSLIRETRTYFLIGSAEYSKFAKTFTDRGKTGNTALYFSPEGRVLGQYLKIRLIPFAEYVPHQGVIPWPDFIVPKEQKYWDTPGKEFTLFEIDGTRFGVIICWESVFPTLFRKFVKDGADFMINITNEGWFGENAAPYQYLSICLFRAVENRVYLVRSANTGVSCFIDPYGRITSRVWNNSKDIFVEGYLTQEIFTSGDKTFYTVYGDIFAYISFMITVLIVALCLTRVKNIASCIITASHKTFYTIL